MDKALEWAKERLELVNKLTDSNKAKKSIVNLWESEIRQMQYHINQDKRLMGVGLGWIKE